MDLQRLKKIGSRAKKALLSLILLLPAMLVILPILLLLSGSLMDTWELGKYISPAFTDGGGFVSWKLLPDYPSFAGGQASAAFDGHPGKCDRTFCVVYEDLFCGNAGDAGV